MASGSVLALRYNDRSVLENYHAAQCLKLLGASALLAPLVRKDRARLRQLVISAILYTDSASRC